MKKTFKNDLGEVSISVANGKVSIVFVGYGKLADKSFIYEEDLSNLNEEDLNKIIEKYEEIVSKLVEIGGISEDVAKEKIKDIDINKILEKFGYKPKVIYPNTLIYGPTGSGKTKEILDFFKALKEKGELEKYFVIPCSNGLEDIDLLCKFIPNDKGGVDKIDGLLKEVFKAALDSDKPIGLLIDEINRASPKALNLLITTLDRVRGDIYVLNDFVSGEIIEVPINKLIIFATANLGGAYSGTNELDEALLDRFQRVIFKDYNTEVEEEIIKEKFDDDKEVENIMNAVKTLREAYKNGLIRSPFSTRNLNNWISSTEAYEDLIKTAFETFVFRLVDVDEFGYPEREQVSLIYQILYNNLTKNNKNVDVDEVLEKYKEYLM